MRLLGLLALLGCGHHVPNGESSDAPPPNPDAAASPRVTIERITGEHRAIPGVMFGGWGPHLGHLVHTDVPLWVDDLCSPAVAGDCNVDLDRRIGVFRRDAEGWRQIQTVPLTGVQQNMATIVFGGTVYSYGVAGRNIVECAGGACTTIPLDIGPGANYVGAAVVPSIGRVVWWTNVVDGGGGSFAYLVNYNGGWNGPRTGAVGGYNNCAYAHVAFDGTTARWFCQVVSGLAPNWSYATLTGTSAQTLADPVAWANGLAPPANDSIMSTDDLYVDAQGAHLLARSTNGAAVYYYAAAGAYAEQLALPGTYRARWIAARDTIALAYDDTAQRGLVIRTAPRTSLGLGAFDIAHWQETRVPLPAGFGQLYAIYPVSPGYQDTAIPDVEFAIVGSGDEHAAYYVRWQP